MPNLGAIVNQCAEELVGRRTGARAGQRSEQSVRPLLECTRYDIETTLQPECCTVALRGFASFRTHGSRRLPQMPRVIMNSESEVLILLLDIRGA